MAEGVEFVVLLRLTADGRSRLNQAVDSLQGMDAVAIDLHGEITMKKMTCGRYDAAAAGRLPDIESIASLVGWILGRGFFSSETLIGADPEAFEAEGRGYTQS